MTLQRDPQTEKFFRAVEACMPSLTNEEMQYWTEHPEELRFLLPSVFCKNPPSCQVLGEPRTASLPARLEPFNPHEFFCTREGMELFLYGVLNHIRSAKVVDSLPAIEVGFFDLTQGANDREARKALPDNHVFDEDEFWPCLGGMLERQWGGNEGPLLTSGYANIFYVRHKPGEVFFVDARRRTDRRKWSLSAYPIHGYRWGAGNRAFSRSSRPLGISS